MHRSVVLLLLVCFSFIIFTSCDPDSELSYIDYKGVRYMVSGAVCQVFDDIGDFVLWYVEVGTEGMSYNPDSGLWDGTSLLLTATMYIEPDIYEYDFAEAIESTDPGTLESVRIYTDYFYGDGPMFSDWSDSTDTIKVTKTGDIYTADISVLIDEGGDFGVPLTGFFVGMIPEVVGPPMD